MATPADLVASNQNYSPGHQPMPYIEELAKLGYPRMKTAIICCADPRADPGQFLQLQGDVVVFRSMGAKAQNVLESLIGVDSLLRLEYVMVIQHTDCGGLIVDPDAIKKDLKALAPGHTDEVDAMVFRNIPGTVEESVRESVEFLRQSPFLTPTLRKGVSGYVYDIKTGKLSSVSE